MPSAKTPAGRPAFTGSPARSVCAPPEGTSAPAGAGQALAEWKRRARGEGQTDRIGRLIGQALQGGEILALYGELGTGKTALVRGIAAGLGAPPRLVSSPTFVLIHEYRGRLPLAHADLYRIESPAQLHDTGWTEYLDGRTVVAVEWAERAGAELPDDRLDVRVRHLGRSSRDIHFRARGAVSLALLGRITRMAKARTRRIRRRSGRNLRRATAGR